MLLLGPWRGVTLTVLRFPFAVVSTAASVLLNLPRLPSLAREHASLRAAVAQHHVEIAQLHEELRRTREATALRQVPGAPHGIVARIISRSLVPTQHTVLLDRGSRDGLGVESVILNTAGVIGRVVELHRTTCVVMLLVDPESRVAAMAERSRETGLLVGRGHGQCELIYLDAQADLDLGDRVVTAGLGGAFPKGLLLGRITRVTRDERSGTTSAWVAPAARLGQLEEVLCLLP